MLKIFQGINFKLVIVGVLTLIMLIPAGMLESLIDDRQRHKAFATKDVTSKWGKAQTIQGPIISVPYKTFHRIKKEDAWEITEIIHHKHFLPADLSIKNHATSQIKERGIYQIVLYNTKINIIGNFPPDLQKAFNNVPKEHILWEEATISLGISDMKGIKKTIAASFAGKPLIIEPGLKRKDIFTSGFIAQDLQLTTASHYDFQFDIDLNGSDTLSFAPVGKKNTVSLTSDWQTPSFSGAFLPKSYEITEKGFHANWEVLHLNRNYPQSWDNDKHNINDSKYGVNFYVSADIYKKSNRIVKYAMLFILLSFATFFCAEIFHGRQIHPLQYLLVGFAISVFYILLISFSEHVGFDIAYLIASLAIIIMIGLYTKAIFKENKTTLLVSGVLAILYTYFYILLQTEDYALLTGSIALFIALATLMFVTRKIDWYQVRYNNEEKKNNN